MSPDESTRWTTAQEVADAMRTEIERGEWQPGEQIPTTSALRERFGTSGAVVSKAVQRLKNEGLLAGVAGGRTRVRVPRPDTVRDTRRYVEEKRKALLTEEERGSYGASEADTGIVVSDLYEDEAIYDVVTADDETATWLNIALGTQLLRRTYTRRHAAGAGASKSTSYIPLELISANPALLDSGKEPWPGGTMHQLSTVGIEIDHIEDRVTASMPTPEERIELEIPQGIPLLRIVKISYDTTGRPVEVTQIPAPADTVELVFRTQLPRWDECQ